MRKTNHCGGTGSSALTASVWSPWYIHDTVVVTKRRMLRVATSAASVTKFPKKFRTTPPMTLTPSRRCSTRREAPKSGVENATRTTVPRTPEAVRASTIRTSVRVICLWYTGNCLVSSPTTCCVASSVDERTNPTIETQRSRIGIMQTRKKKARPALSRNPSASMKRDRAPRPFAPKC